MKPETSSRAPRRGQALRPGRCSMYFTSCTPMAAMLSAPSAMASAGTKNKSATGGRALVSPVAWRIRLRGQRASELDRGPLAGFWAAMCRRCFPSGTQCRAASSFLGRSSRRLGVVVLSDPFTGFPSSASVLPSTGRRILIRAEETRADGLPRDDPLSAGRSATAAIAERPRSRGCRWQAGAGFRRGRAVPAASSPFPSCASCRQLADARFATIEDRRRNRDLLEEVIERHTASRPSAL